MNTETLFHLCLLVHITCLAALAGGVLANYVILNRLTKYLANEKQKALAILDSTAALPKIFVACGLLLIASGISMVALAHGAFANMVWFKIKMVLVVVIILNPIIFGKRNVVKLQAGLEGNGNLNEMLAAKNGISRVLLVQIILVLTIFTLSVFQF